MSICGWPGGLQLAGHRGPESVDMFAQLKHHSLRHITDGCQQQNESMESMSDRRKPPFVQEHEHEHLSARPFGFSVPTLESNKLFLFLQGFNLATLSSQATRNTPFRLNDFSNSFTHGTLT